MAIFRASGFKVISNRSGPKKKGSPVWFSETFKIGEKTPTTINQVSFFQAKKKRGPVLRGKRRRAKIAKINTFLRE